MNPGVLRKSLRETWLTSLLVGLGLFAFQALVPAVLLSFQGLQDQLLDVPFFRTIVRALLGADLGDSFGPTAFVAVAWVHPVALTLLWAHACIFCSRVPAGEIDRGTVEMILAWPVSRGRIYLDETLVWLGSGLAVTGLALVGNKIGGGFLSPELRPGFRELAIVVTNLFALYLAVGGLAWLVSAASSRRGTCVAIVFAVVLASFFLNFLAQFWGPARPFGFLGLMHYYRPLEAFQGGGWPLGNLTVLGVTGAGLWIAGGAIFARRDICPV